MKDPNLTALITGASSGIGKALAHEFASHNYNLILVARNRENLEMLAAAIKDKYNIVVIAVEKDLARDAAAQELYDEIKSLNLIVNVLVNDAGIGQRGNFVDIPAEKDAEIIHLNIITLTHLTKLFLKEMVARNDGKILQLGSIAGFQPGPFLAVYHASKAFVVSFSEALATELEDMGSAVTITCLCPGPTDTNFFSRADMQETNVVQHKEILMQAPEEITAGAYKALMNGERIYIPGAPNKVMTFIRRAIPKSLQSRMQKKFYETSEE